MRKKGLVGLVVFVVAFLFGVIGNPVVVSADREEPPECSEWIWTYVRVTREGGNTELHLQLASDGQQQGHSNTEWGRCLYCEDIVSVQYQTSNMAEPADAAYECDKDEEGVDFFKIEQTVESNQTPTDFWITIKGESAVSPQNYTLKWATNVCTAEVEWFNCGPPTAVTLRDFYAWSPRWRLAKILSWFR